MTKPILFSKVKPMFLSDFMLYALCNFGWNIHYKPCDSSLNILMTKNHLNGGILYLFFYKETLVLRPECRSNCEQSRTSIKVVHAFHLCERDVFSFL